MTQPDRKCGTDYELAEAVEKNPKGRPLHPQGLSPPLHPDLDQPPSEPWAPWSNYAAPHVEKIEKTVEPVGVGEKNPKESNLRLLTPGTTTSTLTPASFGTRKIQTIPMDLKGPSRKYFVSFLNQALLGPDNPVHPPSVGIRSRLQWDPDPTCWT